MLPNRKEEMQRDKGAEDIYLQVLCTCSFWK